MLSGAVLSKDTQEALNHILFQAEGVPARMVGMVHPFLSCDVTLLPHHVTPRNEFCVSGAETWPKSCVLKPFIENNPYHMAVCESFEVKLRFHEEPSNLNPQLAKGAHSAQKGGFHFLVTTWDC